VFHPTWTDPKTGELRVGKTWDLDYSVHGKRHREPAHTTSQRVALRLLRARLSERESGRLIGEPEKVVLAEYRDSPDGTPQLVGGLRWLHETSFDLAGRRSKTRIQLCWRHLEEFFGRDAPALRVTAPELDRYATARLGSGVSRSTVNGELAALRRGFRLAIEKGLLGTMPVIKLPTLRNARSGFFEEGDFAALVLELPAYLRPLIRFLRLTGWRVSEARALSWASVEWDNQAPEGTGALAAGPNACLRLAASATKGGDARTFPFGQAPDLKALLAAAWLTRQGPFVFQRDGRPLRSFCKAWDSACRRAGLEGRLVHDLRRTAARELRRAGVSEGEIMKLCGWRTRAMFDRYNIIDEADLAAAVAKRYANGQVTAKGQAPATQPADVSSSAA